MAKSKAGYLWSHSAAKINSLKARVWTIFD